MSTVKFYEPSGYTAPSYTHGIAAESRILEDRLKEASAKTGEVPPSEFARMVAARKAGGAKLPAHKPA